MALRVEIDQDRGRALGVVYAAEVDGAHRLQRARFVAIAGYSIETPRLLLASTSARHPNGLCNNEDQVGRFAVRWFERNRAACGPPDLFSEEYDVMQRQLRGNLPQAFVHALMPETASRLANQDAHQGDTPIGVYCRICAQR